MNQSEGSKEENRPRLSDGLSPSFLNHVVGASLVDNDEGEVNTETKPNPEAKGELLAPAVVTRVAPTEEQHVADTADDSKQLSKEGSSLNQSVRESMPDHLLEQIVKDSLLGSEFEVEGLVNASEKSHTSRTLQQSNNSGVGAYRVPGIDACNNDPDNNATDNVTPSEGASERGMDESCGSHITGGRESQPGDTIVVAAMVHEPCSEEIRLKEEELEDEIRKRILEEAVEADQVLTFVVEGNEERKNSHRWQPRRRSLFLFSWCVFVLVVVAAVVAGTQLDGDNNDNKTGSELGVTIAPTIRSPVSPTSAPAPTQFPIHDRTKPTIETIQDRGFIRCGIIFQSDGVNAADLESINIDQCRALSIAVLGSPDKMEITKLGSNRKEALVILASHSVDVLTALTTRSMLRDVYEPDPQTGFTFTSPYVYIGGKFAGIPFFVDCAENLDGSTGDCRNLKVCTFGGTTYEGILTDEILPGVEVVLSDNITGVGENLGEGICNVVFADEILIPQSLEAVRAESDYLNATRPDFKLGTKLFSRDNCGCTTRDDDPEWSNLVNLVMDTFYTTEAANISKSNTEEIHSYLPNNPEMATMLVSIISQLGNYGDIYSRGFVNLLPRQGLNTLYDERQSGLLYSFPFGSVKSGSGPGPHANMTLERIISRDSLLCGVHPRAGFATIEEDLLGSESRWVGFDVEFCRAVAAALLRDKEKVTFVNVSAAMDQYELLNQDDVDVVAGARVTLATAYHEPSTGTAFTFSLPYFYDGGTRDAFALMSKDDDPQWSDVLFWIVNALIYAEEQHITQSNATEMPVVFLVGGSLKQMFRDCVAAVGSYADIYNRALERSVPRSPPNILNDGLSPQQFPIPFS